METFLKDLYQEDLRKQAAADQEELLASLSVSELEAVLGLQKVAVAGPTCPSCPTGSAAAQAKVTDKAPPKKTGAPEEPTGKTAAIKVVQDASKAWNAANRVLGSRSVGFMQRPGVALKALRDKSISVGNRLGIAGRMVAPHLALAAGGVAVGDKLLGGGQKEAAARFLKIAAAAVEGAPDNLRSQAAALAATKLRGG